MPTNWETQREFIIKQFVDFEDFDSYFHHNTSFIPIRVIPAKGSIL